jgi:hypothetical protein
VLGASIPLRGSRVRRSGDWQESASEFPESLSRELAKRRKVLFLCGIELPEAGSSFQEGQDEFLLAESSSPMLD